MNNPATRQAWILEQLTKRPNLSYGDCFRNYSVKFRKTERTHTKDWNKATKQHKERQQTINEAKDKAIISEEVKAAKNGLKSKHERIMILQVEVDATISELQKGVTIETKINGGKASSIERPLNILEKTQLRKVAKELQSEISKIEGDYAPAKQDINIQPEFKNRPKWLSVD